jgi:hypothetical protein
MSIKRAISIRQPYVEQILLGTKRFEFRKMGTRIRERVWIYASLRPADEPSVWKHLRKEPGDLPVGAIVGSVEIADSRERGPRDFAYKLVSPKRLRRLKWPKNQPQPVFWRPKF